MIRPPAILIVDDSVATRELLKDMLSAQGYDLLSAGGGAEALAIARTHAPDLILLDLMMPDIDGLKVCRELRADPRTAHVPVIMITALDDRRSRLGGLEAGCDDFLTKPVDLIELRIRVRTIVRLNRYHLLLDEQRRFERLFQLSPQGLLIADAQGTTQLANPAMAQLLGLNSSDELTGRSLASMLASDDQSYCIRWLAEVVAQRLNASQLAAHLVRHDHSRRPVELDAGWFEWGGAPAVQVVVRDITDRKRVELLEEDKRRLAFDLHDAVAQTATAAYRQLERYYHRYRPRRPEAQAELEHTLQTVRQLMRETRELLAGLRPSALDDLGLIGALQLHCSGLALDGLLVELHETIGARRFAAPLETAVFRIAQEALTNVRKHAGVASARLTLSLQHGLLRLQIEDEGRGIVPSETPSTIGTRLGVRGMHERAALLGGRLWITSRPERGVTVTADLPVAAPQE